MARVLLFDLESTPNLAWVWGQYEQNVIEHVQEWVVLGFAWKWLGEDTVHSLMNPDTDVDDCMDDSVLMDRAHALLDEADILVAHNGRAFDEKKLRSRFLDLGMDPPSTYKSIDTLKILRHGFAFNSNKLDDVCQHLGLGKKLKHNGFATWRGCMAGDPSAWADMRAYNEHDVVLLEKLYLKLRPWMDRHPNVALSDDQPNACPRCGQGPLWRRGWQPYGVTRRPKYQCQACGGYCVGRQVDKSQVSYASV